MKYILKYNLIIAISWTIIIFILCCTPGRYIPTTSWLELLSFDKVVHASIFFVLVILWLIYFLKHYKLGTNYIVSVLIVAIMYGGLLEVMQATIFSQRSGDWFDFIANSFGCILGYLFFEKKIKQLA